MYVPNLGPGQEDIGSQKQTGADDELLQMGNTRAEAQVAWSDNL